MTHVTSNKQAVTLPRQSNFELLRIVAMLLIVAHHFAIHGHFQFSTDCVTLNQLWIQFLNSGGKIGVNVFVLISGYFLCIPKDFSIFKILRLWLQVFFYSILFLGIFMGLSLSSVSVKAILKSLLPITYSTYWFISAYFVLYLFHPFINLLIQKLTQEQYKKLLLLLTFIWSIIPTFLISRFQSNSLWWFVYLYLLAGYIRLYTKAAATGKYLLGAILIYLCSFLSIIVLDIVGLRFSFATTHALFLFAMQRFSALLIAVLLLLGFRNIKIKTNPLINCMAASTLGVYLIHENIFVRPFLWQTVFKNATYAHSAWLIPYSIGVILVVFCVSSFIELMRIYGIEKFYKNGLTMMANYLNKLANQFFSSQLFNKY